MKKVFLGGTCNESNWRNRMMIHLYDDGLNYFNPVVDDWDDECQARELRERETCDFCLYGITPKMTGTYSIAEVVDDSNKRPKKTVLVLMRDDDQKRFTEGQWKSLGAVARLVKRNGGKVFDHLKSASQYMAALSNPTIEYTYGIKRGWLVTGEGPKYVSEREHIIGDPKAYYETNPEREISFENILIRQKAVFDLIHSTEKKYELKLGSFVVSLFAEIVSEYDIKEKDLSRLFFMLKLYGEDLKKAS